MKSAGGHVDPDRATQWPSGPSTNTIATSSTSYKRPYSSLLDDPTCSSGSASFTFPASSSSSLAINPPIHNPSYTTPIDMRTFKVRGLFGFNAAFTTNVPGTLTISFPTFNRGSRAQSEPLPPRDDEDVEMGAPEPVPRARSEYSIIIPEEDLVQVSRHDTLTLPKANVIEGGGAEGGKEDEEAVEAEEDSEGVSQRPRAPSPAATEVDDPESQDIIADIQARGIKIRDFAFSAPPAPSPSMATATTTETPIQLPASSTHAPFTPATEMFDQYKGFAEVEYRWTQPERIYPVSGKTLRRLLDIKWLTQEEVDARAHLMDLEDLRRHDARPHYPWRPFRWTSIPSLAERKDIANARRGMFMQLDRMRAASESAEARRRVEAAQAAVVAAQMEEIERREREERERSERITRDLFAFAHGPTSPGRNKRRLGDVAEGEEDAMNTTDDGDGSLSAEGGSDLKKRRLTPEPSSQGGPPSSQTTLVPPTKQYPAPLHTYNPEYYPEAASIIESSSQSSSQPRPVVVLPERSDTPPLDEGGREIAPGPSQGQGWSPGKGAKLVHPRERKAMKRALSRTQTFAQLIV